MRPITKLLKLFLLFALFLSISCTFALAQYGGEEGESEGEGEVEIIDVIGGGHVVLAEDLELGLEKYLDLGAGFYSTPFLDQAFRVPEQVVSKVRAKVIVKNIGQVTAINIRLKHSFDPGLSDMVLSNLAIISGPVTYNPKTGIIKIDEIPVGGEVVFFYELTIDELGTSDETAADILTLASYESKLPIYHAVISGPVKSDIDHLIASNIMPGTPVPGIGAAGSASSTGDSSTSGNSGGLAGDSQGVFMLPQTGLGYIHWLFLLSLGLGFSLVYLKPLRR